MKRFAVVFATVAAAGVLSAAPASADASACVSLDISVNGQGAAQNLCLPPG